eukprot:TRINITY_DN19210_c0_g1_i1.p1 TRINITY_DN19210_c0_g1~~TRINITY_DN19210_c0_g1_i1.p1  ORF type:complete len:262 (+),score=41.38 TRINITY_DN19210_c0_g1_i1:73-786(+)
MATCRGCCKMGYPLQGGYCTGCRGDCYGGLGCRSDRERGWNPSNRVQYKDAPPLLGDMQFPMQERLRRDYPHRRMPETLCDCEKCKSLLEIRRDGSMSPTVGHTPGGHRQPKRIGYTPPSKQGPTPTKSSLLRSKTSQDKYSRGGSKGKPALTYGTSSYSYDPAKYSRDRSISPEYERDNEEVAYQKLWAAFHTIRGAVIEQQQHEDDLERRIHQQASQYTPVKHGTPYGNISARYS